MSARAGLWRVLRTPVRVRRTSFQLHAYFMEEDTVLLCRTTASIWLSLIPPSRPTLLFSRHLYPRARFCTIKHPGAVDNRSLKALKYCLICFRHAYCKV